MLVKWPCSEARFAPKDKDTNEVGAAFQGRAKRAHGTSDSTDPDSIPSGAIRARAKDRAGTRIVQPRFLIHSSAYLDEWNDMRKK